MEKTENGEDRILRVLLVEDEKSVCEEFISYIDTLSDTELVGVTASSYEGFDLVRSEHPDALILDLELHNGSGNGLLLLNDMRSLEPSLKPYTLITTNNSSSTTFDTAREMGADFILSKHQGDYSPRSAVDFLRMMNSTIRNRKNAAAPAVLESNSDIQRKRRLKRICAEFDALGMSNKSLGYQYLTEAIEIEIEKPTPNLNIVIGKRHGKTSASIERAMQNAIERTWNQTPLDVLTANYTAHINPDREMPSVMEFISFYSNRVKNGI